ncbi:MAG: di-trans,poly-cis-decaprenylcistransferase [Clostridia bacterium]|nr:di-trans,poly-cis-decaprenylcistransferase [Clostridia bacterium]
MEARKIKISKQLDLNRLPKHIAIIMDGNGRWATKRGLPRNMGHKAGCENLKRIIEHIYDLGISCATFYTFSTENWKRPQEEIDGIFNVVRDYLDEDGDSFVQKDARVVVSGDYSKLPQDLVDSISRIIQKTKNCKTFTLNLAINYGGRDEILRGVNSAIENGQKLDSTADFAKLLYNADLPEPDFVIRTSGEMRLSNFMLWQMAYSELYFTKIYWPSFTEKQLQKALIDFQKRKRRFGAL